MRKVKRRRYKVNITDYIFLALYVVEFLGAALIGFFGNSFFAYEEFHSLWANIFYLLFVSSLYITAFVQEVYSSRAIDSVITNIAVFILGLVMFLLLYILDGIFTLFALVYSAIMVIVLICRHAQLLNRDETVQPDVKRILAVTIILIFSMVRQLMVEYVNNKIWSISLIPTAIIIVLTIVITIVLVKKVWTNIYPTTGKSIGNAICVTIMLFYLIYMYSVNIISVANCVFDGEPTAVECTVLEKKILYGTRTVTRFEVKISIDSTEKWINIPVTEYYKIAEGDSITVDYYSGAFNLPYYTYSERN